jgi:hypothetical protein
MYKFGSYSEKAVRNRIDIILEPESGFNLHWVIIWFLAESGRFDPFLSVFLKLVILIWDPD